MGFIQDQQAAWKHRAQPLAHWVGIGRLDEQAVGYQKPAVSAPRVNAETTLPSHL